MSNELTFHSDTSSGDTVYAMLEDTIGRVWNGSSFVTPTSGDWATYVISMNEVATSTGIFRGDQPPTAINPESYIVRQQAGGSPAVTDPVLATGSITANVYHAAASLAVDGANSRDEYMIHWFLNGVLITSGITLPTIEAVDRDNVEKIAPGTVPTQVGSTGAYIHNQASNRLDRGQAALVKVGATINGAVRTWRQTVWRDHGVAQ